MTNFNDDRIMALYILARQEEGAAVTNDQKQAIEQLKKLAVAGNSDAALAVHRLKHGPGIHPFLKEILSALLKSFRKP